MAADLPKTYKAAVVVGQGKPLEIQDLPIPELQGSEILVKVKACGVCFSDNHVLRGDFGPPGVKCLGHEFVGDVVKVGPNEKKWKVGDRVGGAWHGGHDGTCRNCNRGRFQMCDNRTVNGVYREGGFGQYATLRSEAGVRVPKEMDPTQAGPLLCAGVTVFNGIRNMHIESGGIVAIQGLGGLGHLALQYSRKMGYRTVALSRGTDKKDFATQLGANDYIDTEKASAAEELQKMGGADLIVVTAPNPEILPPLLDGLAPTGTLLTLTAIGPVPFNTVSMVLNGLSVRGWPSGHALDAEEAIAFAQTHDVKVMVEKFPLEKANDAIEHLVAGKMRFRGVLTME